MSSIDFYCLYPLVCILFVYIHTCTPFLYCPTTIIYNFITILTSYLYAYTCVYTAHNLLSPPHSSVFESTGLTPATAHRHGGGLHPSSHHYYTTLSGDGDHNNHSMSNSMNNSMCYPHGTGIDGHLTHGCTDETNSNDSSTFSISPSLFASPNSTVKPPLMGCNYTDAFNDMRSSAVKRQIFGQTLTLSGSGGMSRGGIRGTDGEGEGMGGCGGEVEGEEEERGEQRTPGRGVVTRSDAKNGLDILADGR